MSDTELISTLQAELYILRGLIAGGHAMPDKEAYDMYIRWHNKYTNAVYDNTDSDEKDVLAIPRHAVEMAHYYKPE